MRLAKRHIDSVCESKDPEHKKEMRQRICDLEKALLGSDNQIELDVEQYFIDGVYVRSLFIPAGTTLTGKIHKDPCINIVAQGEIHVATEEGVKHIKAPIVFKSPAGVKRAGLVIRDTIWITVHANPSSVEQDSEAMADLLTVPSYSMLEPHCPKK